MASLLRGLAQNLRRLPGFVFQSRRVSRRNNSTSPLSLVKSRSFSTITLTAAVGLSSYTLGSIYPPFAFTLLFPRVAPPPPADPTSLEAIEYTNSIEQQLQTVPLLQSLRSQADADEWYETRPYQNYPDERRVNNLTAGALRGPGKLAVPPISRIKNDESEARVFIHLGRGVCGHDGIVHGGLIATLFDESLARIAIVNLPDQVGVTAKLSVSYRAPTKADQIVLIKVSLVEKQGRKCSVVASLEDMDGTLLAEASAVFVQPKYAKLLNRNMIRKAMGEPSKVTEGHPPHKIPVLLGDGEGTVRPSHKS